MDSSFQQDITRIDPRRLLYRALRYWYLIVLSIVVALSIAFIRNRYATRVYPVSASILIKEAQEAAGGKLLYPNNPLVSSYRNYMNELYIIKSYPMMESAIRELNFDVTFYQQGNFLTADAYEYLPVRTEVVDPGKHSNASFRFSVIDSEKFSLQTTAEKTDPVKTFTFNDTIRFEGLKMVVWVTDEARLNSFRNVPFILSYNAPDILAPSYSSRVNVTWAEQGAGVINLAMSGPNPKKDIDFLRGLIAAYQRYDLEKKNQTASRTIEFISGQLDNISDSLQKVELRLERFKDDNVTSDLSEKAKRLYDKLEKLELDKTEMIVQHNYYAYLLKYLGNEGKLDRVILPSSVGIGDGVLSKLVDQMINLQMEVSLVPIEKRINPVIANKIQTLEKLRLDIIESVHNQIRADKIKSDFFDKQITVLEGQVNELPVVERQLVSIKRTYSLMENLYIFLLQKSAEASISKASNSTDIVVVNPPVLAGGAIVPKVNQNYLVALLLGLFIPFALFVLSEFFNNKVQSKDDIEKITRIPIIAGVGHNRAVSNTVVLAEPKSIITESFRALRANLNFFLDGKQKSVFLITSSLSNEGKTFTTINLASIFALSAKKTLIVGADLRKPKIFTDFALNNTVGLSTYLAGINGFDEVVQKTEYQNIDLISGGPVPPNPAELLITPRLEQFIKEAKERYDYVFIDTPPLVVVTDAFSISKFADHTIFVVRQNYTPKAVLRTIQEFYENGRLAKVSIVLNDIFKSGPGYGYGYYGYSYSYGYGYNYLRENGSYYSKENGSQKSHVAEKKS
jgi:capsular exopolysaccharide synthesis family protein